MGVLEVIRFSTSAQGGEARGKEGKRGGGKKSKTAQQSSEERKTWGERKRGRRKRRRAKQSSSLADLLLQVGGASIKEVTVLDCWFGRHGSGLSCRLAIEIGRASCRERV